MGREPGYSWAPDGVGEAPCPGGWPWRQVSYCLLSPDSWPDRPTVTRIPGKGSKASPKGWLSIHPPDWMAGSGLGWGAWMSTEASGLPALCLFLPSPPSQVYLIINPHDLRGRMKNKMCSLF